MRKQSHLLPLLFASLPVSFLGNKCLSYCTALITSFSPSLSYYSKHREKYILKQPAEGYLWQISYIPHLPDMCLIVAVTVSMQDIVASSLFLPVLLTPCFILFPLPFLSVYRLHPFCVFPRPEELL